MKSLRESNPTKKTKQTLPETPENLWESLGWMNFSSRIKEKKQSDVMASGFQTLLGREYIIISMHHVSTPLSNPDTKLSRTKSRGMYLT